MPHRRFLLVSVAFSLAAASAEGASFQSLGFLPSLDSQSQAFDVSADGSTAVGVSEYFDSMDPALDAAEAFRWTAGSGLTGLGDLAGGRVDSAATGVSGDGSVVVGWGSTGSLQATRWTASTGMVGLGFLPGTSTSQASDVSADGNVVVGQAFAGSSARAFRWTASGGMVDIGDLPGGSLATNAQGVSADGSFVVGSSSSSNGTEAYLWSQTSGMQALGDLAGGSFFSSASAVSDDGSVVVGTSVGTIEQAFRWTSSGGMVGLGDLAGGTARSSANAVSADGSVVVGFGTTAAGFEAFIWTASGGLRRLEDVLVSDYGLTQVGSWVLTSADGISADGLTIVGRGIFQGRTQAWIATIPEPHTAALLCAGLALVAALRRRVLAI